MNLKAFVSYILRLVNMLAIAAKLRVKRHNTENRFLYQLVNTPRQDVERKCTEAISKATERAIVALSDRRYLIQQEGEQEQQDIFEAQMIRLGNDDMEIEEWEQERFTYCVEPHHFETVLLASQPSLFGFKCRPRYYRHYG